ncbi:hypothetical protein JTE90_000927 [Oedothorax gibbosus]|uniref:Uncharacterized protein n=1 Tax=Oedothorax gibbosus TaxID=931172 RepID=A0AAV6U3B2_9ARAC|nr:hypothetical protein JTE90_000927 [Oedothorax gibbosus]
MSHPISNVARKVGLVCVVAADFLDGGGGKTLDGRIKVGCCRFLNATGTVGLVCVVAADFLDGGGGKTLDGRIKVGCCRFLNATGTVLSKKGVNCA